MMNHIISIIHTVSFWVCRKIYHFLFESEADRNWQIGLLILSAGSAWLLNGEVVLVVSVILTVLSILALICGFSYSKKRKETTEIEVKDSINQRIELAAATRYFYIWVAGSLSSAIYVNYNHALLESMGGIQIFLIFFLLCFLFCYIAFLVCRASFRWIEEEQYE